MAPKFVSLKISCPMQKPKISDCNKKLTKGMAIPVVEFSRKQSDLRMDIIKKCQKQKRVPKFVVCNEKIPILALFDTFPLNQFAKFNDFI